MYFSCKICNKKFIYKIDFIKHLKYSMCSTIYVNNENNKIICYDPSNIYSEFGVLNIIKNNFSKNNGYNIFKPTALSLLKKVINILEEFNINYFAISGTLLGIVRHNDIIDWDDDIDLIVDDSIKQKFYNMYEKYKDMFHFIEYGRMLKISFINGVCINIKEKPEIKNSSIGDVKRYIYPFIDLFVYNELNDNMIFFDKKWNKNMYFPPKKIMFNNIQINIPNNPEYFLTINYGIDWNKIIVSNNWSHKNEKKINIVYKMYYDDYIFMKNKYDI